MTARPGTPSVTRSSGLAVQNLAKSYKGRPVLRDVSLALRRGEVAALLGPNGAGKTTCFYAIAGVAAGVAGALYAFSKGSISPESLGIQRSVDGLVMVLLGGIHTQTGPVWGAALFTWLQDTAARSFDYWRAATGLVVLALILALPNGIGTFFRTRQ